MTKPEPRLPWCPLTPLRQQLLLKSDFKAQHPFSEGLVAVTDKQCGILLTPSLSVTSFI